MQILDKKPRTLIEGCDNRRGMRPTHPSSMYSTYFIRIQTLPYAFPPKLKLPWSKKQKVPSPLPSPPLPPTLTVDSASARLVKIGEWCLEGPYIRNGCCQEYFLCWLKKLKRTVVFNLKLKGNDFLAKRNCGMWMFKVHQYLPVLSHYLSSILIPPGY